MPSRIEFLFDFGSPNAYLAHRVLPGIRQRTGAVIEYVPVLLGGVFKLTGNVSPAISLQGIKNKPAYLGLEMERFQKRHGITEYRPNPHFPVNTLQIMRGAIVAKRAGTLGVYVDAVYRHMWEEGRKMDDPEVIETALTEAGLDGAAILAGTRDPDVKAELMENTQRAVDRGVFGSPSFFVGDELYFGKDSLRDVEEALL